MLSARGSSGRCRVRTYRFATVDFYNLACSTPAVVLLLPPFALALPPGLACWPWLRHCSLRRPCLRRMCGPASWAAYAPCWPRSTRRRMRVTTRHCHRARDASFARLRRCSCPRCRNCRFRSFRARALLRHRCKGLPAGLSPDCRSVARLRRPELSFSFVELCRPRSRRRLQAFSPVIHGYGPRCRSPSWRRARRHLSVYRTT